MIEAGVMGNVVERSGRSRFGVRTTKDQPLYPGLEQCPHTHQTRLDRDIHRRANQAIVFQVLAGCPESLNFGVSGWVAQSDWGIMTASNKGVVEHDNSSNRDFILHPGLSGFT